jgi:hypothetical protein
MTTAARENRKSGRLVETLERMLMVLERERVAVATFQIDAISALTEDKQRLVSELAAVKADQNGGIVDENDRAHATRLFQRVQQRGHANALLLQSVGKAVSAHLGLADENNLYNARARRFSTYEPRRAKAL